ncbi:MAG: NUDIX hydrolase [Verrucomicrobia bacterium]|nr:NUDIX hydrolase [Verrucomicrobiota bacterium]
MSTPSASGPARWARLGQTTQATTRVLDLLSVRYRHPVRGTEKSFVVVHPSDWCNVLALTPDGRLVLVRQFRFGIDEFSLEIPGGVMEAGEDPVEAGLRELREETGYTGQRARLLGSVHPNPAIQSNRCHFVLVEEAVQSAPLEWDPDEEIAVTTVPVDEVLAHARAGGITHALVLNALFLFEPHWRARSGLSGPVV